MPHSIQKYLVICLIFVYPAMHGAFRSSQIFFTQDITPNPHRWEDICLLERSVYYKSDEKIVHRDRLEREETVIRNNLERRNGLEREETVIRNDLEREEITTRRTIQNVDLQLKEITARRKLMLQEAESFTTIHLSKILLLTESPWFLLGVLDTLNDMCKR